MRIKHPSLPHSLASFFLSISVFIFAFFLLPSSFFLRPTLAQIPEPYVPCNQVDDPEFHSLRPYQASPCNQNKENQAIFCGNELTLTDMIQASVSSPAFSNSCTEVGTDQYSCSFSISVNKNFAIDLSEAEFPILGNTELVRNSRRAEDEIDNAQRLNEYVSWYLNGAVYKPENPPVDTETREGRDALINFSGPVRKLLPQSILFASQINSVETRGEERHNQIVVCAQESFLWFFGKTTPHECYEGHDKDATPDVYRLNDWDGPLSFWNSSINLLVDLFTVLLPDIPREMIKESIGDHWNERTPPLEWDEDFKDDSRLYLKAYNEWRGKTCVLLPFLPSPICLDNPFVRNKWSELFAYVPPVSTEDRLGEVYVDENSVSAPADVTLSNVSVKSDPADLFFAHIQETKELAPLLQSTYLPQGADGAEGITTTSVDSTSCKFADVRANPGDDLFADEIKVDLSYTASFSCTFGEGGGTCERPVSVFLKTLTATPEADEIWARLVNGTASIFKRIFPKIGPGGPIEAIEDIPAATKVTFSGDAEGAGELYFPHVGGIYEYFLQCTQSLLRPKGFGDTCVSAISQAAEPPEEDACGGEFLENLPKAGGSCALGGISSRVGSIPQSLKDIVEAAAETYKVPPGLILGIMFGEGAFNTDESGNYTRYKWTDENVKAWATCTPVPGCSTSGDDNFMGFNSSIWPGIASRIEPDIKKLNPNRGTPSQCNLLDAIYGLAWNLHDSADGGMSFSCFGIDLNAPVPTSCSWNDNQYESAIKVHESGYTNLCFTKEGSCATGGGLDAACPTGGDTCETKSNRYANPSHNGCVWDVAHGK